MKILDRYVLGLFLKNYVITLAVLLGMYVTMDMVFKIGDIVAVEKRYGAIGQGGFSIFVDLARYYFYQCFLIFVQLSGIIPVIAAAFTLMRLSRFGELTAFLAAGVPLLRVSVAIIVASVALNIFLMADQELVLPRLIPQLTRKPQDIRAADASAFPIPPMQVGQHSLLVAAAYHPSRMDSAIYMEEMDVLERDEHLQLASHLFAKKAVWDSQNRQWHLIEGRRVTGLARDQVPSDEMPVEVYKGEVTPPEIALFHSSASLELLSTRRINELLATKKYGAAGLYRIKHLRFTQPIMNVILVLLAIPAVLTFDPKMLKTAATQCLFLLSVAMGTVFLAQQIAGHPPLGPLWANAWPALMAWMPIFIFGPLSAWLLDRVRT